MSRLVRVLLLVGVVSLATGAAAGLVGDVRSAIAQDDFAGAEAHIRAFRAARGVTTEVLEALSWLGRGALARRRLDQADRYAAQTRKLALEMLKSRGLDADRQLPLALGASIEVQAQVMGERGERSAAIDFLNRELETYRDTSIRVRIQKNINLLGLEGKPAPLLEVRESLGGKSPPLAELKGRPVLLFFWAHWCPDCKQMAPALARLSAEYSAQGLVILSPTQNYGYTARGQEATPEEELKYIDQVRGRFYSAVAGMTVPVSQENFRSYGASTTPTLVLIDRQGIVRLYHPGQMSYEVLAPKVAAAVR